MGKAKACSACSACGMLLGVILLTMSFETLTPLEAGIRVNFINSQILAADKPYTAGRHAIGILYNFIKYPSTLQTVEFTDNPLTDMDGDYIEADGPAITAATSGGQTVRLEISFQYRLMLTQLEPLYRKYEKNYHTRFVTTSSTAIREISTRYETIDYFTDREAIAKVMHAAINVRLQEYYAVVVHFQLRRIDVPTLTERTILEKLTKAQGVFEAQNVQVSTLVRAGTGLSVSTFTEQAKLEVALAQKEAAIIGNKAQANSISISINATTQAYKMLKEELELDNEQLIQYLYLEQVRNLRGNDKLAVNIDSALFNF